MIRLKFLLYTIALITVVVGERICEKQGTCKRCDGRGRFSYYTCQNDDECFREERCREGFCCPRINSSILDDPSQRPFSSAFSDELSRSSSCPDGSSWMRLCKSDLDCLFDDEVCSLGKCCSSCLARRRQILREHPQEALVGYHIPECSEDGRFYQLKQCIHGFPGECFCVSLYGQRTNPSGISGSDIVCGNSIDENLNNKPKSPYPEEPPSLPKSPYPEEPPQQRIPPFAHPTTETLSQSDHFLTLGRNGFNNGMQQNPTVLCNDRNKEFKPCLNACFVACDTRTKPQCPNAGRCNPGCQCKLPYILESSHDQNSRCILASECSSSTPPSMPQPRREPIILPTPGKVVYKPPIYPFSSDDGFDQFPHGAVGFGVDRSRQMHCIDPLKNFLTCGSACPPACGRFSPACSFQCVSGCFCRTPYVLSDVQNANSACILPQHCDIQGSSFDRATLSESAFPSEKTTSSGPAFTEELISSSLTTTESSLEPITISSKKSTKTTTKSFHRATTILPPITCADKNKEFQSCGSSCPLACDNLDDAQNCSPCVSGCFCKNGYVFESVKNWTDGICVKIEKCSHHENSEDSSTTTTQEPPQMAGIESIGAQLFTTDSHQEIGRFTFSTSVNQKIQFNARITFLPKSKSKTFIIAIHKYGALATDIKCEAIGDVIEINPVYSYPFPNGTLLYLKNPKIPYASSYTFKASNDFAEKSVGAVIGRSLALHEFSNDGSVGEPLGCATVGILQS